MQIAVINGQRPATYRRWGQKDNYGV